jgi:hypothetical protein
MPENRVSPIVRVVEEVADDMLMTEVNRRLLAFFRAGVPEVWLVCSEMEDIQVVRPGRLYRQKSDYFPADFEQFVADFFRASARAAPPAPEQATEAREVVVPLRGERKGREPDTSRHT